MKIINTLFAILIILAVLAGLMLGGYYAIKFGLDVVARLDYQTAVSVTVLIMALLIAAIVARRLRRAGRQRQANLLHNEKAATYQLLTEVWSQGPRSIAGNQTPSEELRALDRLLSLYGSPRVVKAYVAFRQSAQADDTLESTVWTQLTRVVWEMRRDLGADTSGLTAAELQQLLSAEMNAIEANVPTNTYPERKPHVALAAKA